MTTAHDDGMPARDSGPATAVYDVVTGRRRLAEDGPGGDVPPRGDVPSRGKRPFLQDILVTFVVFAAGVGLLGSGLWIRDAVADGDSNFILMASSPPVAAEAAASAEDGATSEVETDGPPAASSSATSGSDAPGATTSAEPGAPSPLVDEGAWIPVVEQLDSGASLDEAEQRAAAVTSLGYPAVPMLARDLDGFDRDGYLLVGIPRDTLEDALATCEGRQLLQTCRAHRRVS